MCKKGSARYLLQVEARLGSVQVLAFDVGGHWICGIRTELEAVREPIELV